MSKSIDRIKAKAEQLRQVRQKIDVVKESTAAALKPLEDEREILQQELIGEFDKEGLSSIKTDDGATYAKAKREGVTITNEAYALGWAIENRAISINSRLVAQKLKDAKEIPAGFERVEVEYISVRSPKKENEE